MAAAARPAASSPHSLSRTDRASCPRLPLAVEYRAVPAGGARGHRGQTGPAAGGGHGRRVPRRAARARSGGRAPPTRSAAYRSGARRELREEPGRDLRAVDRAAAGESGRRARGAGSSGPPIWLHGDLQRWPRSWSATAGSPGSSTSATSPPRPRAATFRWRGCCGRRAGRRRLRRGRTGRPGDAADDAARRRARGWALNLGVAFLALADNPLIHGIGRRAVRACWAERRSGMLVIIVGSANVGEPTIFHRAAIG